MSILRNPIPKLIKTQSQISNESFLSLPLPVSTYKKKRKLRSLKIIIDTKTYTHTHTAGQVEVVDIED